MNAIINNLIVRYIKAYIKQHQHFEVNLFVGEVSLKNAFFDSAKITSLFQQQNPHLSCTLGKLGTLKVEIPWTTISKESVYVTLEDCYFRFSMLLNEAESQVPVEKIANLVLGDDISEKDQSNTLVNNIIQNLKVEIKNLEIDIDIGPELTSSITVERIFYGPFREGEDKDLVSKIIDISGFQYALYVNQARKRTPCMSSRLQKMSLIAKLFPEIHEYIINVKEQCEINMHLESIEKVFFLQRYIQRVFLKHYQINVLTFISILKQKNFIHKMMINFDNLLVNVSTHSTETANSIQIAMSNIGFRMEYYERVSQVLYFLDIGSFVLSHNGSALVTLIPISPQNTEITRKFTTFETQLQPSESHHIKLSMIYEDRQKTKISKIQMFQYGWEVTFYVDNLLKHALQIKNFVQSIMSQLSHDEKEPVEQKEEHGGQVNTKYSYQIDLLFAQNVIKIDHETPLPLLKDLFPVRLYVSFGVEAKLKLRTMLYFMTSEMKFHQLLWEDSSQTPLFNLRDTTIDTRYDVTKNSLQVALTSGGADLKLTSEFIHQMITGLQILPSYISKLTAQADPGTAVAVEEAVPVEPSPSSQEPQLNAHVKATISFINLNFGETSKIASKAHVQTSLFREYLGIKIKDLSVESSQKLQKFQIKQQISCKFFPANSEIALQVFKKVPFVIKVDVPTLDIEVETGERIEVTLTPEVLKYIQALASNEFLYGNYIINYLPYPVTIKTEKLNGRERSFYLQPKQMYCVPVFQEKGQEALNVYQLEVTYGQDKLCSEPINLPEIVQSSYNLQLDMQGEEPSVKGMMNCALGTLRVANKDVTSVFLTGAGYFLNLLNIQFKISYPTLTGENKEVCLRGLSEIRSDLENVQDSINNGCFKELFEMCECITEQIAPLEEKKMILTNLRTMNYYTSSKNIIGGNTIQFFDVNNEECPVLQIIKKPLVNSSLYILKTPLLLDNHLDIPLSLNFNKTGSFKVEMSPMTREFVVPAEDFTIFAYKVQFIISFNYLGMAYETATEEIAGYSYTEAFLQEKGRRSREIKLKNVMVENENVKSPLHIMLVRYYHEESLMCELKHPMKIENSTEWFFELVYETTSYRDVLEPNKNRNSFHCFSQEKKFQIRIGHKESMLDDRSASINVDLTKLKETGSCILSFNFVAREEHYYQVPVLLKYTASEQDFLKIIPLVVVNNSMDHKISIGGLPIEKQNTSAPVYFAVSIDQNLNNQACFFASLDSALNIKSPSEFIFEKVLTDMRPPLKVFNKSGDTVLLEKALMNCLKDYLNQSEYSHDNIGSEYIDFVVQKKEVDGQMLIYFGEQYSDVLPSYVSFKNKCNRAFSLIVSSKHGKRQYPLQALAQDILMVPFKIEKPLGIELQFSSKSSVKVTPDKRKKSQQYKKDGIEFIIEHYIENNMVNLVIYSQEEGDVDNVEQVKKGSVSMSDFAVNLNFYMDVTMQDHLEVYLDLKDIKVNQEHVELQLKKLMVNSCLSQTWKVQELFDQNISLCAGLAFDYKMQNNLLTLSKVKVDVSTIRVAVSDTLLSFFSNFFAQSRREVVSSTPEVIQSPTIHTETSVPSQTPTNNSMQPMKKLLLHLEDLTLPSLEISLDLDLKDLIKVSHTLNLEPFIANNRVVSPSTLVEDISSSYIAQLISGFPSLLLRLKRIPNPFTLIKDLKNLSTPSLPGTPMKFNQNQPIWSLYCHYYLKMKVIENFEEDIVLLSKCKLVKEKPNFPEKKCFIAITSKHVYIFQYNEVLECHPIKRIEMLSYNKKKEQLTIQLFREEPILLKVTQRQYEKLSSALSEVLI